MEHDIVTVRVSIPDRCLSPNARVHWARKAKAKKAARGEAWAETLMALELRGIGDRPMWEAATIEPFVYRPNRHQVDGDNMLASLKASIDGLTDAGLLADDKGVRFLPCVMGYDKADPRVELVVRRLAAEDGKGGE